MPAQHREDEGLGRSRGGLTSKIHLPCEGGLRPLALLVTPGQTHDGTVFEAVVERIRVPRQGGGHPRTRPDAISADKAYSSRRIRSYLRRSQIPHAIPEKKDQARQRLARGSAGGRPPGFDRAAYKRRNEVERTINALKAFRAVGEVDSGRPAGVSTSGFLRAASRTRRARLRAPGSPQIPFRGVQFLMP
ncbi:transposase [Streptomyces sp. V4I8]